MQKTKPTRKQDRHIKRANNRSFGVTIGDDDCLQRGRDALLQR